MASKLPTSLDVVLWSVFLATTLAAEPRDGLMGHWPLAGDVRDHSGQNRHGKIHQVDLNALGPDGRRGTAAAFDGQRSWIELPGDGLPFGRDDFTIAVRVYTEEMLDDLPGDILSQYDPVARRGVNFGILSLPGSTTSQPNERNVHFGIDNDQLESAWTDHGRPGHTVKLFGLVVYDGSLYAATCERGPDELGRVYRLDREKGWVDCGAPDRCNAVASLAIFKGQLYAATAHYRMKGSGLPETKNQNPGGNVYRYQGGNRWEHCGRVSSETEAVFGFVVFRGELYASSGYKPAGLFRYEGGTRWTALGSLNGWRSGSLGVHNGRMYISSWDNGNAFEFDGEKFTDLGRLAQNTQTYGFVTHRSGLLVATWPSGRMYRHGGGQQWIDAGRLGEEKEVIATALYNGKVYAGSLPHAKVFRYDDGTDWTEIGRLDHTPDVTYRRACSMAIYNGRLFVGTLPEGKVHSIEAGKNATVDRTLLAGWRHLAAVRRGNKLEIFVDGTPAAESAPFDPNDYDLTNDRPLRIGTGENDFFNGRLADLRIYNRALTAPEIRRLNP